MWALGSQNQLLGYISLILVMEQFPLQKLNSHLSPTLQGSRDTCLAAAPHRNAEQLWDPWGGRSKGRLSVFKLSWQSRAGLIFCFNGSSVFLSCDTWCMKRQALVSWLEQFCLTASFLWFVM